MISLPESDGQRRLETRRPNPFRAQRTSLKSSGKPCSGGSIPASTRRNRQFALGAGTLVSPLTVKLNGIPAIPILAALPAQKFKFALLLILIPTIALLLNQIYWLRGIQSVKEGLAKISKGLLSFLILALFFGYQSGGTFITKALNPFGIKWWSLAGALLAGQVAITFFTYLVPKGIYRLRSEEHTSELQSH